MGAANATSITASRLDRSPINLFLMINTFETGGSERQFAVLAQNARAARFQVHLGCVNPRGPLAGQFGEVAQFPLGNSLFGWQSLRTRLNLARHLRRNHVEIAHAFDFYTNLTLIPAARLGRVPVVIGSHRQLGDLMTRAQNRAQAVAFRWCNAVVCNSRAGASYLAAAGVAPEKLVVIGNALPAEVFERASPALLRRSGVLRVVMVARMNAEYKGHAGFLRIAADIRKSMPEVEFVLVGDGLLRPELERQATALGLGERVVFLGDRRDVSAVLASTDVAVLTSDSEGLSNAILEAQAAALPVVAYDVGGNGELVDAERGALVAAGNEREFASAVCRLLLDASLRKEQGENAQRFAEENYSVDRVCRQYEDLYVRLLNQKRRNPCV